MADPTAPQDQSAARADQPASAQTDPTAAAQPEVDKVPLLAVLHDLGQTLTQSEMPAPSQIGHVVGAIVKVLDHAKVEVADELWPAEPAVVARPETADAVHRQKTDTRLQTLEHGLAEILAHLRGNGTTSSASDSEESQS